MYSEDGALKCSSDVVANAFMLNFIVNKDKKYQIHSEGVKRQRLIGPSLSRHLRVTPSVDSACPTSTSGPAGPAGPAACDSRCSSISASFGTHKLFIPTPLIPDRNGLSNLPADLELCL
jgi:hypothetical protein